MKRSLIFLIIFLAGVLIGPLINPFSLLKEYFEEDAVSFVI
ncbi:hypothetical protein [Alkalihalobacillus sp. AL-G]|nr:hypothetical protein [Alkalihalobacillus sp. AL-G]